MASSYLIHAWCNRPFITCLCPVEAASPAEAIAIARQSPKDLEDAAEQCNRQYPWDEFAAYDDEGNELLHVLDEDAQLRLAAPKLLEALRLIARGYNEGGMLSPEGMQRIAEEAIAEATRKAA